MGTHYETLGVTPSATAKEIRKAYLRRARALHPDRQLDRSEADARRAEEAMQVVNAAWDVLSDAKKKAAYDQRIKGTPTRPTTQRPPQQRPSKPRAASPNTAQQRPRVNTSTSASASPLSDDSNSGGFSSVLASIPVLILIGVIVGVIIVVFFVNNDSPRGQIIVDNELILGDCFILVSNEPIEVDCASGSADGQVTSVGPDRGNCPDSSQPPLRDPNPDSDFHLCWVRMIPGSSNTVP